MSQDLEVGGNVTEQKAHAMDFLKMDFHHTGVPLGICTTILLVALIKPGRSFYLRIHGVLSYKESPFAIIALIQWSYF